MPITTESRMTELNETLHEINARQIATHPLKQVAGAGRHDVYITPDGRLFIVQVVQMRKGDPECWDVFVPASKSAMIADTVTALRVWAKG